MSSSEVAYKDLHQETFGPEPIRPPEVVRAGLGFLATFPGVGIQIRVRHLRNHRGEVHGGVLIKTLPSHPAATSGHLFAGRVGLSSIQSRNSLAKYLTTRWKADWDGILEQFSLAVLQLEEEGEPFQEIGGDLEEAQVPALIPPILDLGEPSLMFGPGATGKTTLAAAIAVSSSTGVEVVPGWRPAMNAPVLVLDWESRREAWSKRIRAICKGLGLTMPRVHYRRCVRSLVDDLEAIAEFVTERGIGLVIVDSAGGAMEGDSSDGDPAGPTQRLFNALRAIGAASLVVDHVRADDRRSDMDNWKPYGSVYKENRTRYMFGLKREKEPTENRAEILVKTIKVNEGPMPPAFGLVLTYDADRILIHRGNIEAPDLEGSLSRHEQMRRLLLREGAKTIKAIAEEMSLNDNYIRSLISKDHGRTFDRLPDGRVVVQL